MRGITDGKASVVPVLAEEAIEGAGTIEDC